MSTPDNPSLEQPIWKADSRTTNRSLILIGGALLLIVLLIGGLWISLWRGDTSPRPSTTLEAFGLTINIFLTGGLIYIYFQIAQTQAEERDLLGRQTGIEAQQAEIQSDQSSIMKLAHDPLVLDEGWTLEQGDLTVTLSNVGNGAAKNLRLRTVLVPLEDDNIPSDDFISFIPRPLYRIRNYSGEAVEEQSFRRSEGGILRANEVGEPFEPTIFSPLVEPTMAHSTAHSRSFFGQLEGLKKEGYQYGLCQIVLRYENGIGETASEPLTTAIFELDSASTAEDVFVERGAQVPYLGLLVDMEEIEQPDTDRDDLESHGINPENYLG